MRSRLIDLSVFILSRNYPVSFVPVGAFSAVGLSMGQILVLRCHTHKVSKALHS